METNLEMTVYLAKFPAGSYDIHLIKVEFAAF